jgi:uncharacterized membrane-anchored protein
MSIVLKIDVSKIDKKKIVPRTYTDKNGNEVTAQEYSLTVVELKQPKVLKEGDNWKMVKTHFAVETQTKEEKEAEKPDVFLGDGVMFQRTGTQEVNDGVPF